MTDAEKNQFYAAKRRAILTLNGVRNKTDGEPILQAAAEVCLRAPREDAK